MKPTRIIASINRIKNKTFWIYIKKHKFKIKLKVLIMRVSRIIASINRIKNKTFKKKNNFNKKHNKKNLNKICNQI